MQPASRLQSDMGYPCDLQGANEVDVNVPAELSDWLVHQGPIEGSPSIVHKPMQGVAIQALLDLQHISFGFQRLFVNCEITKVLISLCRTH